MICPKCQHEAVPLRSIDRWQCVGCNRLLDSLEATVQSPAVEVDHDRGDCDRVRDAAGTQAVAQGQEQVGDGEQEEEAVRRFVQAGFGTEEEARQAWVGTKAQDAGALEQDARATGPACPPVAGGATRPKARRAGKKAKAGSSEPGQRPAGPGREGGGVGIIYFFDFRADAETVRVGYDGTDGRRIEEHERQGQKLIAVMPGTEDFEGRIHKRLKSMGASDLRYPKSTSHYHGESVWDYVVWLVRHGKAAVDRRDLDHLPVLPWDAISPDATRTSEEDRQLSVFPMGPRQRIARASEQRYNCSNSDEWYTPESIIESARIVMGGIDLDPASCPKANEVVRASHYYSERVSGLDRCNPWLGRVWMNPPYGSLGPSFTERLIEEVLEGNVTDAIALFNSNSMTSLWFDDVYKHSPVMVVTRGRLNFTPGHKVQASGNSPSTGNVIVYFGRRSDVFVAEFSKHGNALRPES